MVFHNRYVTFFGCMVSVFLFIMIVNGCTGKKNYALYQAVYKNDLARTSGLIDKGLDPDVAVGDEKWRPVVVAVFNENKAILDMLLNAGADPDATLNDGTAALHLAAKKNDSGFLESLIASDADVNIQNKDGLTPLFMAVTANNTRAMAHLILAGADVSISHKGWTPLNMASFSNHLEAVDILLDHGATPTIHDHAALNHLDRIRQLVRTPEEANLIRTGQNLTPLHFALKNGHMDVARYLISMGADVQGAGSENLLPVHLAALWNDVDMLEFLFEQGADVTSTQKNGSTPLHMAASAGNTDIISFLLEQGAETDAVTQSGQTPLFAASANNHPEAVRLLIEKGADPHKKHQGWTPLMIAANNGFRDVVKALVDAGARIDESHDGATALYQACYEGHHDVAAFLLDKGADPSRGFRGWSCLHGAAKNGSIQTVRLLLDHGADVNAFIPKTSLKPMDIAYDHLKDSQATLTMLIGDYGLKRLVNVRTRLDRGDKTEALLILKDIQGYYHHHAGRSEKRIARLRKKIQGHAYRQKLAASLNLSGIKNDNPPPSEGSVPEDMPVGGKTAKRLAREMVYRDKYIEQKQRYQAIADCIRQTHRHTRCFEEPVL